MGRRSRYGVEGRVSVERRSGNDILGVLKICPSCHIKTKARLKACDICGKKLVELKEEGN